MMVIEVDKKKVTEGAQKSVESRESIQTILFMLYKATQKNIHTFYCRYACLPLLISITSFYISRFYMY